MLFVFFSGEWDCRFQKGSKSGILHLKGTQGTAINTPPRVPKAKHLQVQEVWIAFILGAVGLQPGTFKDQKVLGS